VVAVLEDCNSTTTATNATLLDSVAAVVIEVPEEAAVLSTSATLATDPLLLSRKLPVLALHVVPLMFERTATMKLFAAVLVVETVAGEVLPVLVLFVPMLETLEYSPTTSAEARLLVHVNT